MNEDEIVSLGNFCETLQSSPHWIALIEQFEKQTVSHMLATEAHEVKKREGIFTSLVGVRDLLGHMTAIKNQRDEIIERNTAALSPIDEDAPIPMDFD